MSFDTHAARRHLRRAIERETQSLIAAQAPETIPDLNCWVALALFVEDAGETIDVTGLALYGGDLDDVDLSSEQRAFLADHLRGVADELVERDYTRPWWSNGS